MFITLVLFILNSDASDRLAPGIISKNFDSYVLGVVSKTQKIIIVIIINALDS